MKMVINNLIPTVRNRKCPTHLRRAKGLWFINLSPTGWLLKTECTFPTTTTLPRHDDTTKIPVYNTGGHRLKKGHQSWYPVSRSDGWTGTDAPA